jgi:hypothetical protein
MEQIMNAKRANRLHEIFKKAITGQLSVSVRKRLASGEDVSVTVGEDKARVFIKNGHAFMTLDAEVVVADAPFVPWSEIDDDYEKMIASFGDDGVNEDWFQSASELYFSRFN